MLRNEEKEEREADESLYPSRIFVQNKIMNVLKNEDGCSVKQSHKLSIKIEEGIHDYVCELAEKESIELEWSDIFTSLYLNASVGVYTNLDPDSNVKNTRFRTRVVQGEFLPHKIARLSPQEMFPEKWKDLLDEKFKIDKQLYETRTEAATDIYKCGKCHKRICTYFQLQTRSADEPMTTFVTCINCGNRWKH